MSPLVQVPEGLGDEPRLSLEPDVVRWLLESAEQRRGHHGENGYKCGDCGQVTMTVDVHPGVTPMFLGCRRTEGCRGMARSSGYPAMARPPELPAPAWEWYRPSQAEYDAEEDVGVRDHVARGGLLLRERTDLPAAYVNG